MVLNLFSENSWGLGVKDLECFNLALLGKWVWRYLREGNRLWVKVINSRSGEMRGSSLGGDPEGEDLNHLDGGVKCGKL
ncbi:hypothetical protein ACS0TY_032622 [Phlomoides rotata]